MNWLKTPGDGSMLIAENTSGNVPTDSNHAASLLPPPDVKSAYLWFAETFSSNIIPCFFPLICS